MTTNKYTATRKTENGKIIDVTAEHGTWDEEIYLDGQATGNTKTHLIGRTTIVLRDAAGKWLAEGDDYHKIDPILYRKNYADLIAKGVYAQVGDAYITQAIADLIDSATAEAQAATPKTAKQVEIETAEAERKAKRDAWENSPEGKAEAEAMRRNEQLMRDMDRPDSDY